MTKKSDQPERHDRALERLLVEALQPAASAEAVGHAACPDAEILAAYADQGLGNDERERLEGHMAACGRCQEILAVLDASGQVPLAEPQSVGLGEAAVTPVPATPRPAARPSPSPQRWLWWLTPAFGAAAAALLWMVFRPAAPGGTAPVQTAADYSRSAEKETDSLTAQANLPAPAAEAIAPRARMAESASPGAKADTQQKGARNEQPSREITSLGGGIAPQRDESAQSAPATLGGTLSVQEPPAASAAIAAAVPPATPAPQQGQAAEARGNATDAAQPQNTFRNITILRRSEFVSPDGSINWRVGAAGRIERSTDRGQSWQQQASGVTAELLAGSAVSNDVVWVVGRAGIILRTTNGQQWQPVAAPSGTTADWGAVSARDAMSATVVSADAVVRRFSTTDGGRTWTQQQ